MPTDRAEKKVSRFPVKVCVSLLALFVLLGHVYMKTDRIDGTAVGLLAIAILPWLADLLETLELPGGWKFHFRGIEVEQTKQRMMLEQLQLAVRLLLTDVELRHLKNFAGTAPMPLRRDGTTPNYEKELRRLRALGLLEGSAGPFFREGGDAHKYLRITDEGIKYLRFRVEQNEQVLPP
jgi:hypothetical protein